MYENLLTDDQVVRARSLAEQMYNLIVKLENQNAKIDSTFKDSRIEKWRTDTEIGRMMTETMNANHEQCQQLAQELRTAWAGVLDLAARSAKNNAV